MFTNSLLSWTRMLRKNPGVRPPTFPTPVITRAKPTVSIQTQVGISTKSACARDLFAHQQLGMYNESFTARVNPSGVAMVKLTPICEKKKKSLKKKRGKGKESHKRSCCIISCWYNLLSRISWFEFPDSFYYCNELSAMKKSVWNVFLPYITFFPVYSQKGKKNLNKSHFYCLNDWFQQNIDTILLIIFPRVLRSRKLFPRAESGRSLSGCECRASSNLVIFSHRNWTWRIVTGFLRL